MKLLKKIFFFYTDGFKNMSHSGKQLWLIIILKLLIMFGILKIFFFKNYLNERYETEAEKIEHVSDELTKIPND